MPTNKYVGEGENRFAEEELFSSNFPLLFYFLYFERATGKLGDLPIPRFLEEGQALEHRFHHLRTRRGAFIIRNSHGPRIHNAIS